MWVISTFLAACPLIPLLASGSHCALSKLPYVHHNISVWEWTLRTRSSARSLWSVWLATPMVLHPWKPGNVCFPLRSQGFGKGCEIIEGSSLWIQEKTTSAGGEYLQLRVLLILNWPERKWFAVLVVGGGKVLYNYRFVKTITLKVNVKLMCMLHTLGFRTCLKRSPWLFNSLINCWTERSARSKPQVFVCTLGY